MQQTQTQQPQSTTGLHKIAIVVHADIETHEDLWVVNFYLIAPIFGWTWFPEMTDPLVQFVAHAGFFGVPLGLYVAWALRRGTPRAT